ncbi:MAG: hypothetical protein RRB13_11915 [bacterium]|nr:hypothetical protein [bacterium]
MFTQRTTPIGALVPEAGDTAWQNHHYRGQYLAGLLLKSLAGRSRLVAGGWDGADLTGVVAEFFDATTGQLVYESKTDLVALVIPTTPTIYYAKKGLAALQSVTLEVFNNSTWPEDQVPVLVAGYYQSSATETAPFAEFVGPMLDPRASRGEPDLIINGGCRTAQHNVYTLGAGCVNRGNRQFGAVDRLAFYTTLAATEGTADQNPLSTLAGGFSARFNNVSLPAGGKLHRLYRMEAKDAARLKGGEISLGFESLHNAEVPKDITVTLRYADANDNFTTATEIVNSGPQAHPSGAVIFQPFEGVDLAGSPVENGLEIEITLDCGVEAVAGLTWEIGALRAHRRHLVVPELMLPGIARESGDCQRYFFRKILVPGGAAMIATGRAVNSTDVEGVIRFPVEMRAKPSCSFSDSSVFQIYAKTSVSQADSGGLIGALVSTQSTTINLAKTSAPFVAGESVQILLANVGGWFAFNSEL